MTKKTKTIGATVIDSAGPLELWIDRYKSGSKIRTQYWTLNTETNESRHFKTKTEALKEFRAQVKNNPKPQVDLIDFDEIDSEDYDTFDSLHATLLDFYSRPETLTVSELDWLCSSMNHSHVSTRIGGTDHSPELERRVWICAIQNNLMDLCTYELLCSVSDLFKVPVETLEEIIKTKNINKLIEAQN